MTHYPESPIVGISRSHEKTELFLPYKKRGRRDFKFYQLDIVRETQRLFALLDELQPDYVINFSAQGEVGTSWKYPDQWYETNALAIVKLANFLKDRPYVKRYVHISTPEVYGSCDNIREDAPMNPSTPYAASKASGDLFLFTLVKQYGFPLTMIRSTNVYGKNQQLYRIIPRAIIYLKMGRQIPLHGGGRAIKSYIHIKDVCEGIIAAIEKGKPGEIYHFSPDTSISIRDLVEKVCELMGYDFSASVATTEDRPGQDAAYIIDSSKARQELGWRPLVPFDDGLREMTDWVEKNYETILREPLEYVHLP